MQRRLVIALVALAAAAAAAPLPQRPPDSFAARIAALSEPGGYFDTDNLISNERSYLHVLSDLETQGVRGGAYLGVGPDQNYSYIAEIKPSMAFLVDIRRDNLLLHLLFKSLFVLAETPAEYLSLLLARPPPATATLPIDALLRHFATARPWPADRQAGLRATVRDRLAATGVPLSDADLQTIERFHRRFIDDGVALQFNSTGRAPQPGYPTYGDLLSERDREGRQRNFLASPAAYDVVRQLHARDLIIPVVGDLAGPHAIAAIGRLLTERGERVSAFYTSNVEFYLFRSGSFGSFVGNLATLPRAPRAVVIRSFFGGIAPREPGYNSTSATQPLGALVDGYARGGFRRYNDLYPGR